MTNASQKIHPDRPGADDTRDAARRFIERGWSVVPVKSRDKAPTLDKWQELRIKHEDVNGHFRPDSNIGLILGSPSMGLIDVDLDCPEALRIAQAVLPPTNLVHGRPSSLRSHFWYTVPDPGSTQRFKDPVSGETLIEVRGTGGQTVVPPSQHPTGEILAWDQRGDPGSAEFSVLVSGAKRIAAIALLARHWNNGSRNEAAKAVSGFLLRHGYDIDRSEEFLRLVATAANDEEIESRVRTVRDTKAKLAAGRPTTGIPTLVSLVGPKIISKVQEWLGLGNTSSNGDSEWEPPLALGATDRLDFPTASLPIWLRAWVEAEAMVTQTPPDLAGMLGLTVVSAAIAKKVRVRINESWAEPTNVYGVTVLAPGNRKSAVYSDATRPIQAYEASELARLEPEIAAAESRHRIDSDRLREAEKAAAKAGPGKKIEAEIEAETQARDLSTAEVPSRPRFIVDDCTPEQLATILQEQNGRIAIMAPEGDIFEIIAGRYTQKTPNLGVFLRGHSGEDLRVDRVNRKSEFVKEATITIGLTIQPETLRGLAATPQFEGRGLTARFLYAVPESPMGRRKVNPPPMPPHVAAEYQRRIRTLLDFQPELGTEDAPLPELQFDPDARQAFYDYQAWLEPKLAETGELGFMAGWAGKLMGAVARIAGILHMAEYTEHAAPWKIPIGLETISCALVIGDYLTAHARIAFGEMGADKELADARYLSQWLRDRQVSETTKKKIFDGNRGRFRRVKDLDPVLEILEECGYLRRRAEPEREGAGRRPSPIFDVNPLWLESV